MGKNLIKITFITTVNHNIGDDFVREGLKYIFKLYFKNDKVIFSNVHKHIPITTRYGFENFSDFDLSTKIDKILPYDISSDRILDADIIVQSGAPVYWCHNETHCFDNEWYQPLIEERYKQNRNSKLLNLAAGTCQRYHSDGSEFCNHCNNYIKDFYNLSNVTTVRDTLAKTLLSKINLDPPVIPCSSIFAVDKYGLKNQGEEYVVVNYMRGGAHYTFGQKIDLKKWEDEFSKFYFNLKIKENVIISCHNQKEVNEALKLDADANIFFEKNDYLAYMKFYSRAKFGIVNRVHAAFLLASYGKPATVIGNDTRAKMVSEIGLKSFFVNDVDYKFLNQQYEYLNTGADSYKTRFERIKAKALQDYMNTLSVL